MKSFKIPAVLILLGILCAGATAADLAGTFSNPPDSAKPHTWWHWMNGNITREGITADLEAMKRVGVGGAQIFNVDCGIPAGPVKFMSPEWRELTAHAFREAARLGIELCIHNCGGWSSSGGPWNTPEHAMQMVVTSEIEVTGPKQVEEKLPQPAANLGYYRDIAVLAFRVPQAEVAARAADKPTLTTSAAPAAGKKGKKKAAAAAAPAGPAPIRFAMPPANAPAHWVQLEYARPFTARTLTIVPGPGLGDLGGSIQVSEDGKKFRNLRSFSFLRGNPRPLVLGLGDKAVTACFFRLLFNKPNNRTKTLTLQGLELSPVLRLDALESKAGFAPANLGAPRWAPPVPGIEVKRDEVIDLTAKMSPDGTLAWDAPAGQWTIQRIGHTPTGKTNHPAPAEGTGPECDKMSREALDAHWAGMMKIALDLAGPLAGKSLNNALIDSYEVGGQNWTPRFREEFKRRRGYDILPFLPALTGRIIESPEVTERFLWDLRRTISDLFAENYYGYFAELCHKAGLQCSIEPYTGPFESLQVGAPADIPMGEFWSGSAGHGSVKLAASVGHIYGRTFIGAESFTARPEDGRWQNDPWSFKALGDRIYCTGVNRYIFHRYAHQPWLDKFPGMTMGQWGFHFERTNTWWEQGRAWLQYCARCQALLQSGTFVADAAYFLGEDAPAEFPDRKKLEPALPDGYDFDGLGADALAGAAVDAEGRLTLAGGMKYRVLALPASGMMRPATLRKIKELVQAGATVIGPRPSGSPSLQDYPKCDEEVRALADELWGASSGKTVNRAAGKGRVISGMPLVDVFDSLKLPADFNCVPQDAQVLYIHRRVGDAEVYFVSNQRPSARTIEGYFRVSGKTPELWHPDTGVMETAPVWHQEQGRTAVTLRLDPAGSVFVVFRRGPLPGDHVVSLNFAAKGAAGNDAPKLVIRKAVYEAVDGAGALDVTKKVAALVEDGKLPAQVENALAGKDPAYLHVKRLRVEYELGGKPGTMIVPEHGTLEMPQPGGPGFPDCEVAADEKGALALTAWQPGAFTMRTGAGKEINAEVASLPGPIEIAGPWEVDFPPNWGAPAKITLDKLISWTGHPEAGVKYFSGTATYRKTIEIPEPSIRDPQSAIALDLGAVKNIAEVRLNGKDLGILWKPPFRVDLAGAARPGANQLEIRVTNMWCNRLIGDEQLPEDCEWEGKQLKAWPQWLLEGKPRPSGRLTFTTWHHFDKDSELLESGLLGPVVVRFGAKR